MKTSKTALIITGAIDIKGNIPYNTTLIDTNTRLDQYISSLVYAINNYKTVDKIIFVENTGYKYDYTEIYTLADTLNIKLEILTFRGAVEEIVKKGKGFGEGEMIKYSFANSRLLALSTSFVKLTGRLIIENFDNIMKNTDDHNNYFMLPFISKIKNSRSIPTVFYKVNKEFYGNHLLDVYKNVNDNKNVKLEHVFYKEIPVNSIKYFKYYPTIRGQSGSSGIYYNDISQFEFYKRKIAFRFSSVVHSIIS